MAEVGGWETKAGEVWEGKKTFSEERLYSFLSSPATWHLTGDSGTTHGRPSYRGGCVDVLHPTPGKRRHPGAVEKWGKQRGLGGGGWPPRSPQWGMGEGGGN